MAQSIVIKGARVHNLKNIDLTIPRDRLVVFTGLSGSGKSSLAFDTLYAEGHRRFVESLSSYARMFLGQMDKPDIDSIEGLSPAISIDQKTTSRNPRSTVGTVTEIYDYLRLLYARIGIPHCPVCGKEIRQQTTDQIIDRILKLPVGTRFLVLSPVVRAQKGMHEKVLNDAKRSGYVRVRVDGNMYDLSERIELEKNKKHNIEIVVDRLVMKEDIRSRLSDSVENALKAADGHLLIVTVPRDGEAEEELRFSQTYACEEHGVSFGELEPRMFSFNNPQGACPHCAGLGEMQTIAVRKLIPDDSLSLSEGAIAVNGFKTLEEESWNGPLFAAVGERFGFTLKTPVRDFTEKQRHVLFYGSGEEKYHIVRYYAKERHEQLVKFEGLVKMIETRMKMSGMEYYQDFVEDAPCPVCHGKRLSPEVLSVTVGGLNIYEFCNQSVKQALAFLDELKLGDTEMTIAREILKEVRARLGFLVSVGLDYLTLSRKAGTLSGGEAQRIRLATQIGSSLMGVLYILDEPSIGLHQRDNDKLLATLKRLRDLGNTLIVVEHDEDTMRAADYIVDIGPGAGVHGGRVVAAGTPAEVMANEASLTGQYLSGRKKIETPKTLDNVTTIVTGSVKELCSATAKACVALGYRPFVLTTELCCQAKEAGSFLGSIGSYYSDKHEKIAFIAGGETVVKLTGDGLGGRNQEIALAAAAEISGKRNLAVFSIGSDGTDGPTDAAGGYVDGDSACALQQQGISIADVLRRNDAYHGLAACDGLLITGPTGTNVNDVSVVLIDFEAGKQE